MASSRASLENKIKYTFKDDRLLQQALRHPSMDHQSTSTHSASPYERLEFLGDRVLGLVVADLLFTMFPKEAEGILARRFSTLVRKEMLAVVADEIDLPQHIQTADGEVTKSMSADACEAVIGAIYKDSGFVEAQQVVTTLWTPHLEQSATSDHQDAKSKLQEKLQSHGKKLPTYKLLEKTGPDHDPHFTVQVSAGSDLTETAEAATKKQAEQLAASKLLKRLNND